jgi:hypothetical protein
MRTADVIGSCFDDDELNDGISTKAMPADLSIVPLGSFCQKESSDDLYEVIARLSYFTGPNSLGIYNNLFPGMSCALQPHGHKVHTAAQEFLNYRLCISVLLLKRCCDVTPLGASVVAEVTSRGLMDRFWIEKGP